MLNEVTSMLKSTATTTKKIDQQIQFFIKVIGTTLKVFGGLSAIAQVVLLFLEPESRLTTFLALIVSLGLFWLGTKSVLNRLLQLIFSHRTTSKIVIFCLPIFLTGFLILLRIGLGYEQWKDMNTEGGFIEYGTCLAFLLAGIFAFKVARNLIRWQERGLGYFYYVITVGFFLVGMEEISWGQMLFGFESVEFFQTYNSQEEITIHNLIWINEYLDKSLMFVSLIAGISWFIYRLISKVRVNYRAKYLIPAWFLASFFLSVFIFFYLIEYVQIWNPDIENFQESFELIFSLGCLGFILTNFFTSNSLGKE